MRIWPSGAWFGLTKRRLQVFGFLITGILGIFILSYLAVFLLLSIEVRRAATLLGQLNNVKLGDPQTAINPLLRRYEDLWYERQIGTERTNYILRVDPWHFYRPFVGPRWIDAPVRRAIYECGGLRRALGLRAWVVNGDLILMDERVVSVWAEVIVEGQNEWLMTNWTYAGAVPSEEAKLYKEHGLYRPEMERYLIGWTHLHMGLETGEALRNWISSSANGDEQQAARNINLRCLRSFTGCHSLCEFMPDANRYRRQHDYPGWGWNSGSWGQQDHACE